MADRIVGKAGSFSYNGAVIPITKWSAKVTRNLATSTDNADYSPVADMIGPTQIPVSATVEVTIEGRFRKLYVPNYILQYLFLGVSQVPMTLNLDTATVWGHGLSDISDFTTDLPVEDVVTFTATARSYGLWTPNQ